FAQALVHAHQSTEFAELSGAGISSAIARGNLAHLLFLLGRYDDAARHQQVALTQIPRGSDFFLGALDTYAGIRLAQGRLDDAIRVLDDIDRLTADTDRPTSYVQRHGALTRIRTAIKAGQLTDALRHSEAAVQHAERARDMLAFHIGTLAHAEILLRIDCGPEALATVSRVAATIGDGQPDLYASSQTLLACLLKKAGHNVAARQHFERGERFYVALQHAIGLAAANETWDTIKSGDATSDDAAEGTSFINPHQVVDTLASTAAILSYHDRLPLVASELLDLVHKTGQFAATGAVIRRKDGSVRTFGVVPKTETTRTLHSVTAQGTLELHVDGDSSAE